MSTKEGKVKEINLMVINMQRKLDFSVIKDRETLCALKDAWGDLLYRCGNDNVFLSYEWIFSYLEVYESYENLFVIVAKYENEIIGICPFKTKKLNFGFGIKAKEISFICDGHTDYQDIIVLEEYRKQFYIELLDYLRANSGLWNVIRLSNIREDSDTIGGFARAAESARFEYKISDNQSCFYLNLSSHKEKQRVCQVISQTKYAKHKQRLRMLERLGEVRLMRYQDRNTVLDKIGDFFCLHQKRWAPIGKVTKFDDYRNQKFLVELINNLALDNFWVELASLEVNQKIVAIHLHFNRNGRYYYYNCTFDPDYGKYSPGKILNWFLFKDLVEDKHIQVLDFLRGQEDYKKTWACTFKTNKNINIYNPGQSLFSLARKARQNISKAERKARPSKQLFCLYKREPHKDIPVYQPKSGLEIKLKIADEKEVKKLLYCFWSESRRKRFDEFLQKNYQCIIGTDNDDNILGYCWIARGSVYLSEIDRCVNLGPDECAFIDFYVAPLARKKGVYKMLCSFAISKSREQNFRRNFIWCLGSNEASIKTFSFFDFTKVFECRYIDFLNAKLITKERVFDDGIVLTKERK